MAHGRNIWTLICHTNGNYALVQCGHARFCETCTAGRWSVFGISPWWCAYFQTWNYKRTADRQCWTWIKADIKIKLYVSWTILNSWCTQARKHTFWCHVFHSRVFHSRVFSRPAKNRQSMLSTTPAYFSTFKVLFILYIEVILNFSFIFALFHLPQTASSVYSKGHWPHCTGLSTFHRVV